MKLSEVLALLILSAVLLSVVRECATSNLGRRTVPAGLHAARGATPNPSDPSREYHAPALKIVSQASRKARSLAVSGSPQFVFKSFSPRRSSTVPNSMLSSAESLSRRRAARSCSSNPRNASTTSPRFKVQHVPRRTSHCQSGATYGQRSDLRCVMASGSSRRKAWAPHVHGMGTPTRDCDIEIACAYGAAAKKIAQAQDLWSGTFGVALPGGAAIVT